jgi:hypothetical protein
VLVVDILVAIRTCPNREPAAAMVEAILAGLRKNRQASPRRGEAKTEQAAGLD